MCLCRGYITQCWSLPRDITDLYHGFEPTNQRHVVLDTLGYLATLLFFFHSKSLWSNVERRTEALIMEDKLDAILAQYSNFTDLLEPANPAFSSFDPVLSLSTSVHAHEPLLDFPPV